MSKYMTCDEGPVTMVPFVQFLPTRWFWNVRAEWLPFFSIGLWLFSFGVLRGCTHDHQPPASESYVLGTVASLQDRILREQEAHDAVREQRDIAIEQLRLSDFPRLRMIEEKARALHEWNHGHHGACHACVDSQEALRAALDKKP